MNKILVVVQIRVEADLIPRWEKATIRRYGSAYHKSRIVNDALREYLSKEEVLNSDLSEHDQLLNLLGISVPKIGGEPTSTPIGQPDTTVATTNQQNQNAVTESES